jgi:hypothetical protein
MEKMAAAVGKNVPLKRGLAPDDDLPPEYWQALLTGKMGLARPKTDPLFAATDVGGRGSGPLKPKFAAAIRRKLNPLNRLRRNSLAKSVHVIGGAAVHKSSNL